jgi:membrane protein required for colicin V production
MNWLDLVIIAVIVISAFLGVKFGLVKMAFSLAGLIVGVILAGRFYVPFAEQLTFISQDSLARITAFALILIGVMIAAFIISTVLSWLTSKLLLGWIDRLGGAVLGLLVGAIFCGALLVLAAKFANLGATIADSTIARILVDYFPVALALLPAEFDSVRSFFQ